MKEILTDDFFTAQVESVNFFSDETSPEHEQSLSFGKRWLPEDKKKFKSIQKKMFLNLNKDSKDKEKSRYFANVLAGVILLSENKNKKRKFTEVIM